MRYSTVFSLVVFFPVVAAAASVQDGNNPSGGSLTDAEGNSYGIVQIAPSGLYVYDALKGVVRYADMTGKKNHRSGNTVRLKGQPGRRHCRQLLPGTEQANLLDGAMSVCDETIWGYGGDDILIGGPGHNTLDGGAGSDVMTGGGNTERFQYERARDSTVDAPDVITDFNRHDTLDLSGVARTSGVALSFIGWKPFTGVPGQVDYYRMEYWKCDIHWQCEDVYMTIVQADLTGAGKADFSIDLIGTPVLKLGNFVLGPRQNQPTLADSSFN